MKNLSRTDTWRGSRFVLLLTLLAVFGVISGGVYGALSADSVSPIVHQYYMPVTERITLLTLMRGTFLYSALFLLSAFAAGLFTFGRPLGILLLFSRGFGAGVSAALLYSSGGVSALLPVTVILLPKAMIMLFIAIAAVRELMRSSGSILQCWLSGSCKDRRDMDLKLYILRYTVLLTLSFLTSLGDAALNYILA